MLKSEEIQQVFSGKISILTKTFTNMFSRGHVSVFVDVELQFTPFAPIDPIGPLKNVTYSEDCQGTICDLSDVQIIPGESVFVFAYSIFVWCHPLLWV